MNEPLDEKYLVWLYSKVSSPRSRDPSKRYWGLLRQLYCTEFVWLVPNDDNRVEDGRDLRYEFINELDVGYQDREWLGLGCSMLEMLLGLSRRLSFEADGEPRDWFWHILENVDLADYTDAVYDNRAAKKVDETLNRIIFRNYDRDGHGGLFPLKHADKDQTKVEIWYQLSAYILERL